VIGLSFVAFGSALGQDKPRHLVIFPGNIDGNVNSVIGPPGKSGNPAGKPPGTLWRSRPAFVAKLLASHDVETVTAGTAAECLKRLQQETFDCMVLDLSLRGAG
jgi:hypothetical protein